MVALGRYTLRVGCSFRKFEHFLAILLLYLRNSTFLIIILFSHGDDHSWLARQQGEEALHGHAGALGVSEVFFD